jgi:ribulose-phosphate 3-epimerase
VTEAPALQAAERVGELVASRRVAPSILAADFSRLHVQVREVLQAGARVIHCDVMDGHFVPPITFGPLLICGLSELVHDAGAVLDVHLMIERPERHVQEFARAGADVLTVHHEATPHAHYALAQIREAGLGAGLALNPGTPALALEPLAELAQLALCMTVNPGWGGQRFISSTAAKLPQLRALLGEHRAVEVDGGIDLRTSALCVERGANLLVAGSAIFASSEPAEAYAELVRAAGAL